MAGYSLFMLVYPFTSVLLPKYYGSIVQDIKNNKTPRFRLVIILIILVNIMYFILNKMDSVFIPKLQSYVRTNIVQRILQNYQTNWSEQQTGSLISKIVKLPLVIRELVIQIRSHVIPIILILTGLTVRFYIIDKKLGLIMATCIIICLSFFVPTFKKCLRVSSSLDNHDSGVHEKMSELFDNLLDIYAMDTLNKEIKDIETDQIESVKIYKKTFSCITNFLSILNAFWIFALFSIMFYSYSLYKKKQMSLSNIINVILSSMFAIQKAGSFSSELPDLIFNLGIYSQIRKDLLQLSNNTTGKNINITNGDIKFKNIGIKYGDKSIIENFNLHIKPNQSIVMIGRIGSGKTSIIKSLMKLQTPTSGSIHIDDINIKDVDCSSLRSQILYVRQNPIPFNRSLFENITYGNEHIKEQDIENLFVKHNLHSFFNNMKLADSVGKKGNNISGGQRQMIFLLRILLSKKKIIILDEPTTFLDEDSIQYVIKLIKEIMKQRTVIIITHDKILENLADNIVKLKTHN
jgi:ABC-type bacteriocin/lantibiotic exporter with double-glycine peptidase domain